MVWFLVQLALFTVLVLVPLAEHGPVGLPTVALGGLLLVGGVALAIAGYCTLGSSHAALSRPAAAGQLVSTGIYGRIRHPIYLGWIIGAAGYETLFGSVVGLAAVVALAVFYDLRVRHEEALLLHAYPEYASYRARVRRFIPGVY